MTVTGGSVLIAYTQLTYSHGYSSSGSSLALFYIYHILIHIQKITHLLEVTLYLKAWGLINSHDHHFNNQKPTTNTQSKAPLSLCIPHSLKQNPSPSPSLSPSSLIVYPMLPSFSLFGLFCLGLLFFSLLFLFRPPFFRSPSSTTPLVPPSVSL